MVQPVRPSASPPRRSLPRVLRIQSPLTRVAFAVSPATAHLALVFAGQTRFAGETAWTDGPRLLWRPAGEASELTAASGSRGMIVAVPTLALMRGLPSTPLGGQMRRTLDQQMSYPLDAPERFTAPAEGLEAERATMAPGADVACGHYLSLLLVQLWRLARADMTAQDPSPERLAERFVQLAAQHLREHWRVSDYATRLGVSRDRLGAAVQRATGRSPQHYLHRQILNEAQTLLATTGMPVGQIAFRLGFQDPAYFSRFFLRMSGETPAAFRRAARSRPRAGEDTYAAWP
ncbi:MAG: hypothetical protein CML68_10630 [Rhodobacteraceae bacterium]|nr:hypothetical protein [Paracoccaceae bacterium]